MVILATCSGSDAGLDSDDSVVGRVEVRNVIIIGGREPDNLLGYDDSPYRG